MENVVKKTIEHVVHRHRSSSKGANKSSSDTELAQGKDKGRKTKSKEKWPLLDGLTVDELARYRRRRIHGQPKDNLGLHSESKDKVLVSEYCETIGANSEDSLKVSVLDETLYPIFVLSNEMIKILILNPIDEPRFIKE